MLVKDSSTTVNGMVENCKMFESDIFLKFGLQVYKQLYEKSEPEEVAIERNDVYIYETIIYPPKSKPPSAN